METILSISGKPGLYKLVSRGNKSLIVESIDALKKRNPIFGSDRVTSLGDIAMYTNEEDIELWKVLKSMCEKEDKKKCSIDYKKSSSEQLHTYFAEILPDYDRDRVRDSDIKKLIQWYNILVENGYTDFEATFAPATEATAETEASAE